MGMQARATPELGRDDSEQVVISSNDYIQVSSEPECSTSTSATSSTGQSLHTPHFKMEKLTAEDDIEHFLTTFERIAVAYRWRSSDWTFHLIPLLTGKARGAYVNMDIDDALDYQKVKTAILQKYDINPETYRLRFRCLDVMDESPKELYARLKELYEKWTQPKAKTVKEIGELLILEQFLRMLCPELQVWIKEHNPRSAAEAAALADVFVAARSKSQPWSNTAWRTAQDMRRPQPLQHQRAASGVGKVPTRENRPQSSIKGYLYAICVDRKATPSLCAPKTQVD
nr:uncharacterized protein LOC129167139 [Nothobranchius furzeri]